MEDIAAAAAAAAAEAAASEAAAVETAGAATNPADEFDPEGGTTVLTEDMSGPLKIDDPAAPQMPPVQPPFGEQPVPPQPQPQPQPVQKVITPAPVTNSTILNSDVPPMGQQAQFNAYAQQFQPQMMGGAGPVPEEYKPISPLGYLGYSIILALPIIGLIMAFVWGFGEGNVNRRNYARYFLICLLIAVVVWVIMIVLSLVFGFAVMDAFLHH